MKRIVLGSIALIALAGSAAAADMRRPAYKAPPPVMESAPIYNWTGCYIGANVGGLWGHADISGSAGEVSGSNSGIVGGGQIGCDYQMGQFVVGIRDMFDGTSLKNSATVGAGPFAGFTTSGNMRWFDTLTGRGGYLVQPNVLLYVQGGAAWADRSQIVTTPFGTSGGTSNSKIGWTVGGGVEWMFVPHWSAFLEANYMSFGDTSGTVFTPVAVVAPTVCQTGCAFNAKANVEDVLIGVNYRF
jgi:outer membrane immunogenic protein